MKIEQILVQFRAAVDRLDEGAAADKAFECPAANLSDLSDEQSAIASEIIRSVENKAPKLMFLQGSAGNDKTHTVRVILSELHRRGIRCLVSATTEIVTV
jgi:RecG-like helicase